MQEAKRKQMQQNEQILPDEPDERVNESVINEQKMIEQKLSKLQNLLEKQMAGKKRMKQVGSVEIPQEAFLAILQVDDKK